jgi:hypothetical protein
VWTVLPDQDIQAVNFANPPTRSPVIFGEIYRQSSLGSCRAIYTATQCVPRDSCRRARLANAIHTSRTDDQRGMFIRCLSVHKQTYQNQGQSEQMAVFPRGTAGRFWAASRFVNLGVDIG